MQLLAFRVKQILRSDVNIVGIMADEPQTTADDSNFNIDIPTMTDDSRFRSDEMVVCDECSRTNPPNRVTCLYCGADLEIKELLPAAIKLSLQRPEAWEDGYTIAYLASSPLVPDMVSAAAEILHLDPTVLEKLADANASAPVAYLRSLSEAQVVATRLTEVGFPCAIVGDDLLIPRTPPSRLRGIEFTEARAELLDFNTQSRFRFYRTDELLLVSGVICRARSETTAKRSKRSMKVTDAAKSLNDEPVLDIYPPSDVFGFRVRVAGFDFSCLGDQMQRTGVENIQILMKTLPGHFPGAKIVNTYGSLRSELDQIWPVAENDRSSTVSRASFGGVRVHRVSIADNTEQFNRFSRLQRHLR